MGGMRHLVELFADDFSVYPVTERVEAAVYGECLGPWLQTTLHYSWLSERFSGYPGALLPWRIVERDGRRDRDHLRPRRRYPDRAAARAQPDELESVRRVLPVTQIGHGPKNRDR